MATILHNLKPSVKRKRRVRARLHGTKDRPRLSVFRSNKHILLQVIDDDAGKTLAASRDKELNLSKTQRAKKAAETLVTELKKKKIKKLVFDRGACSYSGRVKAVAEVIRDAGLEV